MINDVKASFIKMEMKDESFIELGLGCMIFCLIACTLLFYQSRITDHNVLAALVIYQICDRTKRLNRR